MAGINNNPAGLTLGGLAKRVSRLENVTQRQNELLTALQPILGYYWSDQNQSGRLRKTICFVHNYHEAKVRRGDAMVTVQVADIVALDNAWAGGIYQAANVIEYVPNPLATTDDEKEVDFQRRNGKFEFVFEVPEVLKLIEDMDENPEHLTNDGKGSTAA
jgi:hypothetical protein